MRRRWWPAFASIQPATQRKHLMTQRMQWQPGSTRWVMRASVYIVLFLFHRAISKSPFSVSVQAAAWCSYCTQVATDTPAQGWFTKVDRRWALRFHSTQWGYCSQNYWPKYHQICFMFTTLSSCPGVEPYDVYRWTHSTWENILWGEIKLGLSFFSAFTSFITF